MKETPLLMNGEMVRGVLADAKTQTRRVINPQPTGTPAPLLEWSRGLARACHATPTAEDLETHAGRLTGCIFPFKDKCLPGLYSPNCPYGKPGDRLWVRETWRELCPGEGGGFRYAADRSALTEFIDEARGTKWRPSIHMPRAACRILLEITSVRAERLQEISETDAAAEGVNREWITRWAAANIARPNALTHWIAEEHGGSCGIPYCRACAEKEFTRLVLEGKAEDADRADAINCEDGSVSSGVELVCSDCGKPLDYSPTASLSEREWEHFREQGITKADAYLLWGMLEARHEMPGLHKVCFRTLWDSIYARRGHGWEANPWVWALTFKRIQP